VDTLGTFGYVVALRYVDPLLTTVASLFSRLCAAVDAAVFYRDPAFLPPVPFYAGVGLLVAGAAFIVNSPKDATRLDASRALIDLTKNAHHRDDAKATKPETKDQQPTKANHNRSPFEVEAPAGAAAAAAAAAANHQHLQKGKDNKEEDASFSLPKKTDSNRFFKILSVLPTPSLRNLFGRRRKQNTNLDDEKGGLLREPNGEYGTTL